MLSFPSHLSILLLLLLHATSFHVCISSNYKAVPCNEMDQKALLIFKQGLIDPSNRLSTWFSQHDCCTWKGVQCHNTKGRVTKLDLNSLSYDDSAFFGGEINFSSLLQLQFLNHLDLCYNNFTTITIPAIRDNITTTTSLRYLDLSGNYDLHIDDLHWLSRLSSLKYLDLSNINLEKQTNWLHMVAMLPSLSQLSMRGCELNNIYPSLQYMNFTSLKTLYLSNNNFNSELPHWLFNLSGRISYISLAWNTLCGEIPLSLLNLSNLKYLDLQGNQLNGSIPNWLGRLKKLQHIDLSHSFFSGSIPSSLGNLSSLTYLDISSNLLIGNIPYNLGQLFKLSTFLVGSNSLSGILSERFFSKLSNLKELDLSCSNFEFDIGTGWIPSFQLEKIDLSYTVQGPNFPAWLYTQRSLIDLDISSTGISSIDVDTWSFMAGIQFFVDLSNNSISGDISNVRLNTSAIYLSHNNFTGRLPDISTNVEVVDVSHNSFSGEFPNSWVNLKNLSYINMESNRLRGELPLDMSNLTQLLFIDLGKNELSGNIPILMPPSLGFMILRSNQFVGNIPSQICMLPFLSILDFAHNKLSGSIPQCFYKLDFMIASGSQWSVLKMQYTLIMKGQELQYNYGGFTRAIDLSVNNLSGEIPPELFKLVNVQSLNLSHNHLTGRIPKMLGDMKGLESLDLSNNHFTGKIPQSISMLTFLSVLNLSYNNFGGQIPQGSQLQTFDAWSYVGNPELCGAPLSNNCTQEENLYQAKQHTAGGDPFKESLYLGMAVGFAVSFWGVCGSLFLNKTWRHAYFWFLSCVADRIYVIVAVKFRNLGGR
ncbi:hypothetical protein RIF29_04595 [Crotalaria pallida]|uniref:Leucine-rich repeat-containing N-terminal plant-type domain-containing protein n=1 Tax=Crotalaria pallida TaxID=3830 RepID=A0AAN9J1D7_CROPI